MIRRILLFVYLLMTATTMHATLHGSWHARQDIDDTHKVHLSLNREHNQWGQTFALSAFSGLSEAQLHASGDAPVKFSLARDAGTVTLDGVFGDGEGGGRFTFNANPSFASDLRAMGVASSEDLDEEKLFSLAALDVSRQFIRDMQAIGYRGSLEDYTRFRIHGVNPEYVREMGTLGYRNLSAEELVRFRIHGVTPAYVRDMNGYGYHPSAEEIVRFRIHGVSGELVKTLTSLGYRNLSGDDLVRFRIHGVTSEYVRELKELGYTPNAEDLVRMRIHGVSTEFIRSLKDAGYSGVPVDKLIQMRIHGIDAKYLKAMNK